MSANWPGCSRSAPNASAARSTSASSAVCSFRAAAKLTVGAVSDPAEREADRIASEVLRQIDAGAGAAVAELPAEGVARQVRRKAAPGPVGPEGGDVTDDIAARIERSRAGGAPLEGEVRGSMEQAFGADFGGVR